MSKLFAMAAPILPGKTSQWENFANELKTTRYNDFCKSRENLKVHERTFLQKTPMGDFVLVTLEGDDPEGAFAKFASNNDEFTNWFTAQVLEIHGFDLRKPPESPMPTMVINSRA